MKRGNFPGRRTGKQNQAAERQAEHDKLAPKQRLAKLDERLGKGVGAQRERARLARLIGETKKAS